MIYSIIIAGLIIIIIYYYLNNSKKVVIKENKNIEYFYSINPDDNILANEDRKYICSQYRRRDLQDITSMDIIR